ncbi:hypothetical protein AMTR_s00017p00232160 [Amborella trichopoda]|uniref:Uncharacterized protein n=1 Tax=Amborella trichopoda TaxID=13333 RepID=W1PL13_AMBTC|nr:hypothetical protein AMTR_s00017p00232160 [Amborella trichopoda]
MVTNMFDDMGADFNVPIAVVLDEMKVKKREEKAKAALEVAHKCKVKMKQTSIKNAEKKKKEGIKPSRSSARIAALFRFFDGCQS